MSTTITLRPGYYRDMQCSIHEVFGERDGRVHGRRVSDNAGVMWKSVEVAQRDLMEYLGETLPPDPGPGYRLLKLGERVEPTDEWFGEHSWAKHPEKGGRWNSCEHLGRSVITETSCAHRRRVAPTPPTPPDGWEVMPDGTYPKTDYKIFMSLFAQKGWEPVGEWLIPSGSYEDTYVWYARHIAKPDEWTPTGQVRASLAFGKWHVDFEGTPSHRELRNAAGETKWEPV